MTAIDHNVSHAGVAGRLDPHQPTPNGTPVGDRSDERESTDRGPDTVVELSPQAAHAASETGSGTETEGQPGKENSDKPDGHDGDQSANDQELSEEEKEQVEDLQKRDQEVRRHEAAHKAAAGSHASGGPTFTFQRGPDGKQYAVGGEVQVNTSPVDGDPAATIRKMEAIRRAALSPADPSSKDRSVAAQAARAAQQARQELREQKGDGVEASSSSGQAEGSAEKANESSTRTTDPSGNTASNEPTVSTTDNIKSTSGVNSFDGDATVHQAVIGGVASKLDTQPGRVLDIHA